MLHTVLELKNSVAGMLSGIDLNNIEALNAGLERAARTLVQKADVPEACITQNITLYNGVYDYECDPRIFGTAINDIRPQGVTRNPSDFVYKRPGELFDRTKSYVMNGTTATFEYVSGIPIIRIVTNQTIPQIIIDPMSETTGWVAAGSASGLTQDNAIYYHQPASLRFTLTGSSAGTLTKTLSNTVDLSSYENVGVAFLAIQIPEGATATNLTSIQLKLGSDSGNYDSVTETEGFLGAWVSGEWLLVAFDFVGASSTGTPNWSAIDYVQVTLNHTGTFTNFRVGGLWISQPTQAQILCQSAAIFKAGTSAATTTITTDTDTIILNDPAYTIYEIESALEVLRMTGASESNALVQGFNARLHGSGQDLGLYSHYRGDNPSQELRQVGSWYDSGDNWNTNWNW